MSNKHTAIQSLIEDIQIGTLSDHIDGVEYFSKDTILELLERAKETEREQIIQAFDTACEDPHRIGREYYADTYGSK